MSNMLQTKTAEEILSTVLKPKEFIIDGLLTQGLYVLAGAQKVRKSWMAMDICLSIATGVPVLGRDTIQGTALYLCLEDNYQRLQRRLFQMNAEPIENLHFALATDKIGTGLEEQIEAFKKEHDDLKIVVVDVMQMVRSNVESSYGSDYAELIALKQLAYHLNICILMIHHMRKSKDDNPFNMMTGSTVVVLDSNWRALIELNKLMSQEQLEILTRLSVLATKAETEQVLKTVRSEQRDTIATCRELLDQTSETATLAVEQLKKATADLSSQAGKLNEEYGSKLKELDEYKHRLRSRAAKWIVISQSVLIALSAALQLWLR